MRLALMQHKSEAGVSHSQLFSSQFIKFVLKFITMVVVFEGKLYFCIFRLELQVDEQVSGALIDTIFYSEYICSICFFKTAIRSLQVFNIFEGTLTADPVVYFDFDVLDLLVKDLVEVLEYRNIIVVIEVFVNLAGLFLFRQKGIKYLCHDSQVSFGACVFVASDELISAILLQDQLHFFVELIRDFFRTQTQLLDSICKSFFVLYLNICKEIWMRLVNFIDSRLYRLYFCNWILLARSFKILPNYFLSIKQRCPAFHRLGDPRKYEVEDLVQIKAFPHWIPAVEVAKRLFDDLLKLRNIVTAFRCVGFGLRSLSNVLLRVNNKIGEGLTSSLVIFCLFITHKQIINTLT